MQDHNAGYNSNRGSYTYTTNLGGFGLGDARAWVWWRHFAFHVPASQGLAVAGHP
jgi:hypothetical protein